MLLHPAPFDQPFAYALPSRYGSHRCFLRQPCHGPPQPSRRAPVAPADRVLLREDFVAPLTAEAPFEQSDPDFLSPQRGVPLSLQMRLVYPPRRSTAFGALPRLAPVLGYHLYPIFAFLEPEHPQLGQSQFDADKIVSHLTPFAN